MGAMSIYITGVFSLFKALRIIFTAVKFYVALSHITNRFEFKDLSNSLQYSLLF